MRPSCTWRTTSAILGILGVAVATAREAGAQLPSVPVARAVIIGTVTDTSMRPVGGADVQVIGTNARLAADANGRFTILDVPPGEFLVWVRRLGYQPISSVVHVESGDTLRLAYTMEPTLTQLNPVVVTEKARSVKMREFDERRKNSLGHFMDQAEIEKFNFVTVGSLLRTFSAVRVREGMSGGTATSAREPIWMPPCPMQIFIDGIARGAGLGDLPSPKEIAGIEVYAGPATTPVWVPTWDRNGGKPSCGVILLWTRDGS